MADYKAVKVPTAGAKITMGANRKLQVPDNPIIPYIEGDGTGRDIWRASARVFDAAVEKAYKGKKKIHWMEVYAGEKSFKQYNSWLHEETVPAFTEFLVGIKGPLTTPIGGGMTSLNVGLRKLLDLYVCLRPIRYFNGVPSPVKHPEFVDMVVFRENTEDIYTGIEFPNGTEANAKFKSLLKENFPKEYAKVRFPNTAAVGLKPVISLGAGTARPKFVVLEITARHPEGELTFDDVKLRIRQSLSDQLGVKHYIDQLKRQTYVDIRL